MGRHNDALRQVLTELPDDFKPFGMKRAHGQPTCSSGCRHFFKLMPHQGEQLGNVWGVCGSSVSHRRGLLTAATQGCDKFDIEESLHRDIYHTRPRTKRISLP